MGKHNEETTSKKNVPKLFAKLTKQQHQKRILVNNQKRKKAKPITPLDQNRGLIFIGHIPDGVSENKMQEYFKQFGQVTNVQICRSKKTGVSQGKGYVEFAQPEQAKIAAENMNNYIMFKTKMNADVIPFEKRPKSLFRGKNSSPDVKPPYKKRKSTKKTIDESRNKVKKGWLGKNNVKKSGLVDSFSKKYCNNPYVSITVPKRKNPFFHEEKGPRKVRFPKTKRNRAIKKPPKQIKLEGFENLKPVPKFEHYQNYVYDLDLETMVRMEPPPVIKTQKTIAKNSKIFKRFSTCKKIFLSKSWESVKTLLQSRTIAAIRMRNSLKHKTEKTLDQRKAERNRKNSNRKLEEELIGLLAKQLASNRGKFGVNFERDAKKLTKKHSKNYE